MKIKKATELKGKVIKYNGKEVKVVSLAQFLRQTEK